jgi:hypothetical protein
MHRAERQLKSHGRYTELPVTGLNFTTVLAFTDYEGKQHVLKQTAYIASFDKKRPILILEDGRPLQKPEDLKSVLWQQAAEMLMQGEQR